MLRNLLLSAGVSAILVTGVLAKDYRYTKDIYASIGSKGSYEVGVATEYKNNAILDLNYKNIDDKYLYKSALYFVDDNFGAGIGIIHSKITKERKTKPIINVFANRDTQYVNIKTKYYLADVKNFGAEIGVLKDFNLFDDFSISNGWKKENLFLIELGASIDKIQSKNESLVFIRLHYNF